MAVELETASCSRAVRNHLDRHQQAKVLPISPQTANGHMTVAHQVEHAHVRSDNPIHTLLGIATYHQHANRASAWRNLQ